MLWQNNIINLLQKKRGFGVRNKNAWAILLSLLWGLLLVDFMMLEAFDFGQTILIVMGGVLLGLIALFYLWFFVCYIRNHKNVIKLQDKYVDSLKPDKPLRFCPTDDELVAKYYEAQTADTNSITQSDERENEDGNTNEEQEELELI